MASLTIPPPIISGLRNIADLNNKGFQELLASLKSIPLRIHQRRVFDDSGITPQLFSPDEARTMREAAFALYLSRVDSDVPVAQYVEDIIQSLKEEKDAKWIRSEEVVEGFRERLTRLLSIKTLDLVAKARDVLLEHAQTFSRARIVTDVRPVFGDKVEESPDTAVIVHMFNIKYMQAGRSQEFVVALDTKDIDILMDTLKRAKEKTESLKSVLAQTNVAYVEVV